MNNVITDSGFWFALYDKRDQHYEAANEIVEYLELANVVLPYPILYEALNTRFTRRVDWVLEFERVLKQRNVNFISDESYKIQSLNDAIEYSTIKKRPMSLVDSVIRHILSDPQIKVDYLITFNIADFHDVCARERVEIINN